MDIVAEFIHPIKIHKSLKLFLILFALLSSQSIEAKQVIDSLKLNLTNETNDSMRVVWLNELGYEYRKIDFDTALNYNSRAIAAAKAYGDDYLLNDCIQISGLIYERNGEIERAIAIYQSLIPEDSSKFYSLTGWVYKRLGTISRRRGEYEKALEYYQQALPIYATTTPALQIEVLSLMSLVYNDWRDCENGLRYGWRAKNLYEKMRPPNDYAVYGRLAVLHSCSGSGSSSSSIDSALYYYEKDYSGKNYPENSSQHGIYHHNIAFTLETKGKKREAINRFKKALSYKEKYNNGYSRSLTYHALAEVYHEISMIEKLKLQDSAIYYANRSLEIAEDGNDLRMISKNNELLMEVYATLGNYTLYQKHRNGHKSALDSIYSNERTAAMAEMESKFELKEKEATNLSLMNENLRNEATIQRQYYFFIAGGLLIVLIGAGFFIVYRNNKRIKALNLQIEASNKTKDRLFSIISHDLRGPIASFETIPQILKSYVNRNQPEKINDLVDHIDKSAKSINQLLDNLLNWSMSQQEELVLSIEKIAIKPVIDEVLEVFHEAAKAKGIIIESTISEDFVMADRNTFSTVVRNLISNAIKFSHSESTITINHRISDNWIEFTFSDTGTGMNEQQLEKLFTIDKSKVRSGTAREKGTGLGMVLVKEFVEMNKGQLRVESTLNKGTTFYISLPLAS